MSGGIGRFRDRNKPNASERQETAAHKTDGVIDNGMGVDFLTQCHQQDSADMNCFGNLNTSFDEPHSTSFNLDFAHADKLFMSSEIHSGQNDEHLFDTQASPGTNEHFLPVDHDKEQKNDSMEPSVEEKKYDNAPMTAVGHTSSDPTNISSGMTAPSDTTITTDSCDLEEVGKPSDDHPSITEAGNLTNDKPAVVEFSVTQPGITKTNEEGAQAGNQEPRPMNEMKLKSTSERVCQRQILGPLKGKSTAPIQPSLTEKSVAFELKQNIVAGKSLRPSLGSLSLNTCQINKSSSKDFAAFVTPSTHIRSEASEHQTGITQSRAKSPFIPHANVPHRTPYVAPSNGSKETVDNLTRPKPITPAPETAMKATLPDLAHENGKGSANHSLSSSAGDVIEVKGTDVDQTSRVQQASASESISADSSLTSTTYAHNEDTIFEAAKSNFRDDTMQVYDIQNHRHAELVNLRVRLSMLEALLLDLHSSYDDLTDDIQSLISELPFSYELAI